MNKKKITNSNHFDTIADLYDDAWDFSETYNSQVLQYISSFLDLKKDDVLLDIGGGTGKICNQLNKINNLCKAICIEPSADMIEKASLLNKIETICTGAVEFFESNKIKYTKILMKEMIHHIPLKKLKDIFSTIYSTIDENGKILIVTRPQHINFPLFRKAKEAFVQNQPNYSLIVEILKQVGFHAVIKNRDLNVNLSMHKWLSMVKNRFMSDLAPFSDFEIEIGIQEIKSKFKSQNILTFKDNLIFILVSKNPQIQI